MTRTSTEFVTGSRIYPNAKSYAMSRSAPGNPSARSDIRRFLDGRLRKATIYSVKRDTSVTSTVFDRAAPTAAPGGTIGLPIGNKSEIVTTLKKQFQFNPPDLYLNVGMSGTVPAEATNSNASSGTPHAQIGIASTGIEMLFDRTLESYADSGKAPTSDNPYGRMGVAKDILDIYGVIAGDASFMNIDEELSLTKLTQSMTDLVAQGSYAVMGGLVAIAYSDDFVLYGLVTGMNFRFVKFNHKLVPIMGYVSLNLDVHNANNSSAINNAFIGVGGSDTTATGGGGGNAWDKIENVAKNIVAGGGALRGGTGRTPF